ADQELDLALGVLAPDGNGAHPFRREDRRVFLVKGFSVDAVRESRQNYGTIGQIRQQPFGDGAIVVDEIAFGVFLRRPKHFVEIGEGDFFLDGSLWWRRGRLVESGSIDVHALTHDSSLCIVLARAVVTVALLGRNARHNSGRGRPPLPLAFVRTLVCS